MVGSTFAERDFLPEGSRRTGHNFRHSSRQIGKPFRSRDTAFYRPRQPGRQVGQNYTTPQSGTQANTRFHVVCHSSAFAPAGELRRARRARGETRARVFFPSQDNIVHLLVSKSRRHGAENVDSRHIAYAK